MPSLIPGFEYDIFISYRQKDNKHDGWVTDFVNNLEGELESTFKEEISVYFDENPHDGLLETHDVDASLQEKLKCLIFIPIISRTYCDPKSFAWEHEFKAFVEMASKDKFGLKVKLPNGNITSRVLPVRIHDLDINDIKTCEELLGGVLRSVEFIYKEPGVNRSLTQKDDERKNLNNTVYRNQINKVALSVKDLISGFLSAKIDDKEQIKTARLFDNAKKSELSEKNIQQSWVKNHRILIYTAILILALITIIIRYPKIFRKDKLADLRSSDGRISVVVMPFQNMTNDTTWNVWQDGIQNELINNLTSEELIIRQFESTSRLLQSKGFTNYLSITPSIASSISRELSANVLISGNIKQSGLTVRISAQIIDSKTQEILKSFQIDGVSNNIFDLIDTIGNNLKDFLLLSKLKKELTSDFNDLASTNSPEAYRYFIYGQKSFFKMDFEDAVKWFSQSLTIDSSFYMARMMLSLAYGDQDSISKAKNCLLKINKNDLISLHKRIFYNTLYAVYFETPFEEVKYLKQMLELDDQSAIYYYELGRLYNSIGQYENAIHALEQGLELYKKWGTKPAWAYHYTNLGFAYRKTGQYDKEKDLYNKAEQDFPDDSYIISNQVIVSLILKDTVSANNYILKYKSLRRNKSDSDASIYAGLGWIYSEAAILDKAQLYRRKALQSEPENPDRMFELASLLIDKEININEGVALVNKALSKNPGNYNFIQAKGWGLYKQKKYQEALKLLEKSWELKPIYDYGLFLHIEEVKKTLAESKNI